MGQGVWEAARWFLLLFLREETERKDEEGDKGEEEEDYKQTPQPPLSSLVLHPGSPFPPDL